MKRSKLRKQSKQPISVIQRQIWKLCKEIVREKYGNTCYTCGQKNLTGSNWQTGHVPWPKASLGAYLRYDLRVLRPQCARCNLFMGGMGAEAYKRMLDEEGPEFMAKLERDRNKTVKAYDHYVQILEEYKNYTTENI